MFNILILYIYIYIVVLSLGRLWCTNIITTPMFSGTYQRNIRRAGLSHTLEAVNESGKKIRAAVSSTEWDVYDVYIYIYIYICVCVIYQFGSPLPRMRRS